VLVIDLVQLEVSHIIYAAAFAVHMCTVHMEYVLAVKRIDSMHELNKAQ
jgi:hypothetical protein